MSTPSNPGNPPKKTSLTTAFGAPVVDNQNSMTAGPRGPLLSQDVWLFEKLANLSVESVGSGPQALRKQITAEYGHYRKIADELGIQPE